jgi:ParB family chromosome partitioning protein
MNTTAERDSMMGSNEVRLELRMVAPGTLVIAANVRAGAEVDAKLVDSIKQHGLLQPITARETPEGLVVRFGHRRTLAAVQADREVPVLVVTGGSDDDAERIITQMAENDHRADLNATERAAAYAQLALVGMTATQIARKTGRPVEEVKAGTTVAASEGALAELANNPELTLEDAAIMAEFEDDPAALERLRESREYGNGLAHEAQRIRDDYAATRKLQAAEEELRACGLTVIPDPGWTPQQVKRLEDLVDDEGATLTEETHATCPGHVAWLRTWNITKPVFGCDDPKTLGHKPARAGDKLGGGPMSDEEKTERRTVIANNKAWDSAAVVRAAWIKAFVKGAKAPEGAEKFILTVVLRDGLNQPGYTEGQRLLGQRHSQGSALRTLVGLALIQWDDRIGRHTWRKPSELDRLVMAQLAKWGYQASEVEQLLLAK